MAALAIELNDAGITAARRQDILLEDPGFALLEPKQPLLGHAAYAQARSKPSQINHRFWDALNTQSLPRPAAYAHSHADLVCAHLAQIWEQTKADVDEVIFVVPGFFTRQQLGLLLGISRELAIPVNGMVDAGVAAATTEDVNCYLDIHLHRTVLTRLEQTDRLARACVDTIIKSGLISIHESWVEAIANTFVQKTRFDPLHRAAGEQALYDRLPEWLGALRDNPTISIDMVAGTQTYRCTLQRAQLLQAVREVYEQLVQRIGALRHPGSHIKLGVSHRVCKLPGLVDALACVSDCTMLTLAPGAAAFAALRYADAIRTTDESVAFVTTLPRTSGMPPAPNPTDDYPNKEGPRLSATYHPTHILYQGLAYPLSATPFIVGRDLSPDQIGISLASAPPGVSRRHCTIVANERSVVVEDHSTYGTFVNEHRIERTAMLHVGDRIRVGSPSTELELIALVEPDEA